MVVFVAPGVRDQRARRPWIRPLRQTMKAMPYLRVRDIDIYFDRAGTGAPLLAISGSRGDLRRKPNLLELINRWSYQLGALQESSATPGKQPPRRNRRHSVSN